MMTYKDTLFDCLKFKCIIDYYYISLVYQLLEFFTTFRNLKVFRFKRELSTIVKYIVT